MRYTGSLSQSNSIRRIVDTVLWPSDQVGRYVVQRTVFLFELLRLIYLGVRTSWFEQGYASRARLAVIGAQVYHTGFKALGTATPLAVVAGALVIFQASNQLYIVGGREHIGQIVIMIVVRELAPLVTAFIVIARSGTAVATEVANMRANHEIESLEALGIHPYAYVVFPRIMAGMIATICLAFYFMVAAMYGGYFVTVPWSNLNVSTYFYALDEAIQIRDYVLFITKTLVSGALIFSISCYYGLQVKQGHDEVPIATTRAVIHALSYIIFFNLAASVVFYVYEYLGRLWW
ncbi:ABC transporter permease protein [gamma proteobacterium HTCC5015]|nr:ABC transporter permease protein [gamma proteobacterium HTCC5015]